MKSWSSYGNSYLRHLESSRKEGDSMNIFTQSVQELQSALEAIQMYVKSSSTGRARIRIHLGTISISIESSKEMSL